MGAAVRAVYPALFRQLRYLTGDDALAEELAQETFARAIASAGRYDARRPFGAWVYGIGLNVVRKHWRKRTSTTKAHASLRVVSSVHGHGDHGSPHEGHVQRERSRMLYDLLETLPERWREAFILREIEGLSLDEAAARLEITPKNVSVRATRARARIREEVLRRGWGEHTGGHA
ncbi:MAG: sigma-70 family RNA polymerase sigma factor [Myxococcota bacterium]